GRLTRSPTPCSAAEKMGWLSATIKRLLRNDVSRDLHRKKGTVPMPARTLCWGMPALVLFGTASGCGTKRSNLIKVSGVVTLEGEPLSGAKVTYYPASGDAPSLGVTNKAGRFELTTFDMKTRETNDGALPGEYKVTVEMQPAPAGRTPDSPEEMLKTAHMRRPKAAGQK